MIKNRLFRRTAVLLFLIPTLTIAAGGNQESERLVQAGDEPEEMGLVIVRVLEDSPAEKAGLVKGDILLKIEDQPIYTVRDVWEALEGSRAGDTVELLIRHGEVEKTVSLRLEDRLFRPPIGVEFAHPRFAHRDMIGPAQAGAMVTQVLEGGPAEQAGLRRLDLILSVDGEELGAETDLAGLIAGHQPGDRVTLQILRRSRGSMEVPVELGTGEDGGAYLGIHYLPLPGGRLGGLHLEGLFKRGFGPGKTPREPRFRYGPSTPYRRGGPGIRFEQGRVPPETADRA